MSSVIPICCESGAAVAHGPAEEVDDADGVGLTVETICVPGGRCATQPAASNSAAKRTGRGEKPEDAAFMLEPTA